MAASFLPPEEIMLPPSPPEPVNESTDVASQEEALSRKLEDVTITLSPYPTLQEPPRNRSPFSRTHYRSRSLAGPPGAPMTRAHSTPGLDSRGRYIFANGPEGPSSPMDYSNRRHSPLRTSVDDPGYLNMASLNISETISEHAELDTNSGSSPTELDMQPTSPPLTTSIHHTFPRAARRRPSSPLHPNAVNTGSHYTTSPTSAHPSPMILATRYNESYPGYSTSSGSSVPSTPTSIRSRSPSISSLETIPDIPDAEAAATEADRIANLKAAAEANTDTSKRRGLPDVSGSSSAFGSMRAGLGGYGIRTDKRKRWSVCGAERRQDLDLETIWED